jgi:anti-anti-sigma factor
LSDTELVPASPAPSVNVIFDGAREHGYVAIVDVCGEHDLATSSDIAEALRTLFGSVLVDFSQCSFIDSTVLSVLIEDLRARSREGQRLDLVVPASNASITRTLEVSGVRAMLSVYEARPT